MRRDLAWEQEFLQFVRGELDGLQRAVGEALESYQAGCEGELPTDLRGFTGRRVTECVARAERILEAYRSGLDGDRRLGVPVGRDQAQATQSARYLSRQRYGG